MANPLFNALGGNMPMNNPMGNFTNMMTQFQQFKNNFQGNPQQEVMRLMSSGQMSQAQYNQLRQMAHQFMNSMPKF